jgi:orotidine-5'-phosphate decarboxylase
MEGFRKKLAERQTAINSLVCVGLDPLPEKIPAFVSPGDPLWARIVDWMKGIIDATAQYASMFKPQVAHYESIDNGVLALKMIIHYIHNYHPDIPVFLDCKRGDIDRTQKRYAIAEFEILGADGMNFNPYMGKDCMAQLVDKDHLERAIVGLCYTSNPSAREIQDLTLIGNHRVFLWEEIAEKILRWADELGVTENTGLVMAAAYENPKGSGNIFSEHLTRCREIVGDKLWFLIPGVGTQGGFIEETVEASFEGPGSIAINSSSEIIFASSGENYAEAAGAKACELRDKIRAAGGDCTPVRN